jgi:hypothetical protein
MADYTVNFMNDVIAYLWLELQLNGLMNASDYVVDGIEKPLVPIIPSQQVPEFNNMLPGKPYIVYENNRLAVGPMWLISHEMAYFMVVSADYDFINSVINLMVDLFRRYDNSAQDMSGYNTSMLSSNFDFKYSMVESTQSPSPMKSEGGLRVGHVTIMFCYARHTDANGRF